MHVLVRQSKIFSSISDSNFHSLFVRAAEASWRLSMKQKTVIRVQMNSQKGRTKAMEIAATTKGASSVSIEGKQRDEVVVIGDGVDPIKLTRLMRKKVGHAELISVQEVKELKDGRKESNTGGGGGGGPWKWDYSYIPDYQYQHVVRYEPFYDPNPNACSVM